MNNKSNKITKTISLQEALDLITEIPLDKKNRLNDFFKIYDYYQKQKGIKPEDLVDILIKGISSFPEEEIRILMHVYAEIKSKSQSNSFIQAFILDHCIDRLNGMGYSFTTDTIKNDFEGILNIEEPNHYYIQLHLDK